MKPLFTLFLLLSSLFSFSQNSSSLIENKTIEEQFKAVEKKSSTYKNPDTQTVFKVIRLSRYNSLKASILDSLQQQRTSIQEKNALIKNHSKETQALSKNVSSLESQLKNAVDNTDSRSVMGISVSKSIFSILLVLTHTILIILVGFFAFQYKSNAVTTKRAINNLQNLEEEFEQHKKSSLKRYQEVNRKLQDELNKQWKKDNKA